MMHNTVLSRSDIAEMLEVTEKKVRKLTLEGKLPCRNIGGKACYRYADLCRYMGDPEHADYLDSLEVRS